MRLRCPRSTCGFQEILDNDASEEVEYLKNEDEQWRNNSMWHKGFYEDMPRTSSKPVDAKTFKTYDHRLRLASSHKKALIRAEIMSEAANDVRSRPLEKKARTAYQSIRPVCEPMQGSTMADGHNLIGKSKAASLGVDIVQDKRKIVFQRQMVLRPLRIPSCTT